MTDFFDDIITGPERDRWDRPLLIPRGETEKVPYTRVSSLGNIISDFTFLHTWEKRYLALGLAQNMDLVRLAACETYTTGFDKPTTKAELRANSASGKRLDEVIERAIERRKIHEKADYGTAIHARTEPGNTGTDPDERQAADVLSFWAKVAELGIQLIATEVFVANDEVRAAGTFDHLAYIPTVGIVVVDKKTSSEVHADYDVQLSTYANADIYDCETDERQSLEEYVESLGWDPALLRRDLGMIAWIKNGKTTLHPLDLKAGWEAAKVAAWIRDHHHTKKAPKPIDDTLQQAVDLKRAALIEALEGAESVDRLVDLWENRENQAIWTPGHTEIAARRKEALS